MSYKSPLIALFVAVLLFAAACGSDDVTDVETADGTDPALSQPTNGDDDYVPNDPADDTDLPSGPIPVEPDGGIGDGAEPLRGAEEPADDGTWHGAILAETNCPGVTWQRVQASTFSFSVPSDFTDRAPQGIDSEVGQWSNDAGIEVGYDFGWYSYSLADAPGAEVEAIDYSGITGQHAVVRSAETSAETNSVGVYFPEVTYANEVWDKLGLIVTHTDPNDEIIGRCIVGSIEWNI